MAEARPVIAVSFPVSRGRESLCGNVNIKQVIVLASTLRVNQIVEEQSMITVTEYERSL